MYCVHLKALNRILMLSLAFIVVCRIPMRQFVWWPWTKIFTSTATIVRWVSASAVVRLLRVVNVGLFVAYSIDPIWTFLPSRLINAEFVAVSLLGSC